MRPSGTSSPTPAGTASRAPWRASSRQDLWQRARTFALLNAVMADAYIAGWDSKLHHDFWRPVTAIRLAAEDGNARTEADASWEPLLPTPPVQDHPSTHSALGAAAAVVLSHGFGRDRIRFAFASPTALPEQPTRSFTSFSAARRRTPIARARRHPLPLVDRAGTAAGRAHRRVRDRGGAPCRRLMRSSAAACASACAACQAAWRSKWPSGGRATACRSCCCMASPTRGARSSRCGRTCRPTGT